MKSKEPTEPPGPDTLSYSGSLYHYTNLQGAKGILESGALWATDVSYLNDTSEYTYGGAIIRAALAEFQPDEWVSSLLDDLLAPDPRSLGYNIYAACFCEKPDLLSQWRAYSKSGVGYSLEFDRAHLTTLKRHWEHYLRFDQNEAGPAFGPVTYDEQEQKKQMRDTLSRTLRPLRNLGAVLSEATANEKSEVIRRVTRASLITEQYHSGIDLSLRITHIECLMLRAFLKNPAFREETEWRIVVAAGAPTSKEMYREYNGMLIPYVPLELGKGADSPIKRVLIGPNPYPAQARASFERFLSKQRLSHITVDGSPIPVRL